MLNSVTVQAPAKINLGLKVYPKRADGYHDIKSIFSTVDLYDTIKVSRISQKNTCVVKCNWIDLPELVLPESNTFTVAYKAFCVLTGIDEGVLVEVTKRIPAGGGLGGGSSDASSFIQSINSLFGTHLDSNALDYLSGQVGSDVFFFTKALLADENKNAESPIKSNFASIVGGRGEIVTQIAARNDFYLLLVLPGVSVSTKVAYTLVDEAMSGSLVNLSDDFVKSNNSLEQIYRMPIHNWSFVNDFTNPVCAVYPKIRQAIDDLKSSGAAFADMSGSGSTVFGVFESKSDAIKAKTMLSGIWQTVLA